MYHRGLVNKDPMTVLTSSDDVKAFCDTLKNQNFITVDTEFIREKTYFPKLCLIQISGPDKNAVAIDPLADDMDLEPVFELLADPKIIKVFHAARQDLEIFFKLTGKVVAPLFDSQIAAMVCGYGDSIGYENIVRHVTGGQIDKSSQFTDWARRPLSEKQINYALGDVTHLCDVYLSLKADLEKRGRTAWVREEKAILENPALYENDPYKCWERVKIRSPKAKTLCILKELAAWRELQAQKRDIPKNWVMKDDTLVDLANQAPKNRDQLEKIRGISKDIAKGRNGEKILKAIETALSSSKDTWPQPKKRMHLQPNTLVVIDILKMLLKIQSSEHAVAAKIIASANDIEAIALDDNADVSALKGWRREVFGEDALAIKHGKIAMGLKNDQITKFPIE